LTSQVTGTRDTTSLDEPAARFTVVTEPVQLRANHDPDWLLVAAKLSDLADVAAQVRAAAGPATRIVVLGNGLGAEEALARAALDPTRIFGMLCFVCVNREADGRVLHLAHGQVAVGHLADEVAERGALAALCRGAGIKTSECAALREARWRKLVWNVPYNGLCTAHDCATDRIVHEPALAARARRLMDEVIATANADLAAHGRSERIPPAWAEEQVRRTAEMGPYLPSTTLDRRAGQRLETDLIFAEPWRRAQRLGVDTPELAALVKTLETL
jgi:2-dehydropantoate 2-reductase